MDSYGPASHERASSNLETKMDEGDTQSISVSSGAKSISISNSHDSSGDIDSVEEHRNMMLASLLEDYIRTRAAEYLNATNPGQNYTRQSPEVQPLARQLFADASRTLSSNGVISDLATSDAVRNSRRQYLSALDNLVAGSQVPTSHLSNVMRDLILGTSQLTLMPHPSNDLKLTLQSTPARSHYQSSFQEGALLGRGGFGKVYECFNPLDRGTYAVKKIQLSPRLGKRFRDGKLEELQHILREVQALATLDHPNIVRYHATWLEEPHQSQPLEITHDPSTRAEVGQRQQLLLDHRPFSQDEGDGAEPSLSGGVVFAEDTPSCRDSKANDRLVNDRQWFEQRTSSNPAVESLSLSNTSDIFTDGKSRLSNSNEKREAFEAVGYILYIQMSLYPMTLAQYISLSSGGNNALKHCFHLIPSLRLLHAIHAGLQYIHAKGFIHRDIKPGNIFLSLPDTEPRGGYCSLACNSCRVKDENLPPRWLNPRIGDFGLVTQLARGGLPLSYASNDGSTTSNRPVGTTYYRPPLSKGADDEKVDIFALGVVFIEMTCPCTTAMERAEMLKGLQMGHVPTSLGQGLKNEGYSPEVIDDVVSLAEAMVCPDSEARWSSQQVNEAVERVLHRCESP
ncbi:kinase-like protein [Daldinia vernicosa]|uniref:kinase-like protein n=1 Tax=Daldinia vernicosa TaxID=114800 RepID=UPI002007D85C|nr:kinase-like protein [Daldinia vernicosa]KAI0850695.1 kinase-like protein [Daldinia vernicosa]